ncbi:hypothetical protein [Haloglomus litoreum]|uniref:hypothetical protein n=1 Tax=Haloglomus litoreum TaxID=3034026 RepID=UPI0023E7C4B9|nr:hypothetical protein [Haloglomus sp. DT116]
MALPLALLVVLAGCGSAGSGPTTPPAGTLTPAPVPSDDGLVGGTPTADQRVGAFAIGPTEPLCPSEVGEEGKDYPETVERAVTIEGNWSDATGAARLAERAAAAGLGGPPPEMVPVPGGQRPVTLLGETFDPASRFGVERYALATTSGNRSLDAIVLAPDGNRTTVRLYALTGFC